ncbi:MAG: hypothetical protein HC851_22050 [Acaryochloris sp. RU_4_1]|nr:hypothetical protein [Acaryochloris sp. RU_4_1]NJR55668.1 hypothetical protein [Acaryochloris sp. CRU_2_0]
MQKDRRIVQFRRPTDSGFYAGPNGNWIVWEIIWEWEQLKHFQRYFGRDAPSANLFEVADLFGENSILSIGGLRGELIEPEVILDLKYPSGRTMERSWQYIWRPNEISRQLINADINCYQGRPERFLDRDTAIFKSLVPLKITDYAQTEVSVTEIPLRRLPGMVRPDLLWRLETVVVETKP